MAQRLDWARDSVGWPHRDSSRLVECGGQRWLVQRMGHGPLVLLIHGTGASAHSWRGLMPLLASKFEVLAVDLPGHGFSSLPAAAAGLSLPGMAAALGDLLTQLKLTPRLIVGHSAGAAIALRLCLDGRASPAAVVSFNGALLPPAGMAGQLFSPVARLMALTPFVPRLFAWRASDAQVLKRLLDGTGSSLDAEGVDLYARLVRSPGHVKGALGMMAQWDLRALQRDLPRLATSLALVVGSADLAVLPAQAQQVHALLPEPVRRAVTVWPGLGHLAHEERPDQAAAVVAGVAT